VALVCALAAGTVGIFLFARAGGLEEAHRRLAAAGLLPADTSPSPLAAGAADSSEPPTAHATPASPSNTPSPSDTNGDSDADPGGPEFMDSVVDGAVASMLAGPDKDGDPKKGADAAAKAFSPAGGSPDSGAPDTAKDAERKAKSDAKALAAQSGDDRRGGGGDEGGPV